MEKVRVFYSWQSSTNTTYNKFFIKECIEKAIEKLHKEDQILVEYKLDSDTEGVQGTPDIVNTILEKIENSLLFIADVSFINHLSEENRLVPNPNVLIELGYAAAKLGWDNVVCVFNGKFGSLEKLPFDIRGRRIAKYAYSEGTERSQQRGDLVKIFIEVFRELDIQSIKLKQKIEEEFKDEKKAVWEIAANQGNHWRFRLLSKMLQDVFDNFEKDFKNIEKKSFFSRTRRMNAQEFLDWSEDALNDYMKLASLVTNTMNTELNEGLKAPGDPFVLKDARDKFRLACTSFLDLEYNLHGIRTTVRISKLKNLMLGWTKDFIDQIKHIPVELAKVYDGTYKEGEDININLEIDFNAPTKLVEFTNLVKEYSSNIILLLEDDEYE